MEQSPRTSIEAYFGALTDPRVARTRVPPLGEVVTIALCAVLCGANDWLALEGCVVTIDAMGCQSAIAAQIVEQGADYVLALKANQPTLHATVEGAFADAARAGPAGWVPAVQDQTQTWDKGHGRLERRRYTALSDPDLLACLDPAHAWPGLRSVLQVEAERRHGEQCS